MKYEISHLYSQIQSNRDSYSKFYISLSVQNLYMYIYKIYFSICLKINVNFFYHDLETSLSLIDIHLCVQISKI